MANLAKLEFFALDITSKNYLSWVLDAKIHLNANGFGDTVKDENKTSVQDKAKAIIFLCHHLYEALKTEYLTVKDPLMLWNNLKDRYDHQKMVILPRAHYEWVHLRLQDFKSVTKQNNELLMKNHETRATGTATFPEANVETFNNQNGGRGRSRGSDHGRGLGFGRVELYQRSQKNKEKGVEINFAYQDEKIDNFDIDSFGIDSFDVDPKDQNDATHLNVSDFLTNE
nr:uncharacterized protein [Tanacetum cinerariifolium]